MTDEPMTVAELEALLEGTTPGPWLADRVWWKHHERIADRWEWCIDVSEGTIASLPEDDEATAAADAALIAAAPRIAAALIAALGERNEAIRLLRAARACIDEAQLASIEARNPGIDMDRVREHRADNSQGTLIADLSAFLASHPVAPQPEDGPHA